MCHCLACQKRTGSVFAVQARFAREHVAFAGASTEYTRTGDSGGQATFRFCPTCGATVYWIADSMPEVVVVAVGAFADPSFACPTFSVYGARRHSWVTLPSSLTEEWD